MRKFFVAIVLVVIALPLYSILKPQPFDPAVYVTALQDAGLEVTDVAEKTAPELESVRQVSFRINGDPANIYHYDDYGKLTTQMSYQQPDPGSALVEATGLREALGAAPDRNKKIGLAKNGMWMLVVMSDDDTVRRTAVSIFQRQ